MLKCIFDHASFQQWKKNRNKIKCWPRSPSYRQLIDVIVWLEWYAVIIEMLYRLVVLFSESFTGDNTELQLVVIQMVTDAYKKSLLKTN